jgi:hypothetical protein
MPALTARVSGARLALSANHRGAFSDATSRLSQVPAAAHERNLERVLVDVVLFVGGSQDLRFVDVVDAQRLQDLRFNEMADPALRHDRDGHRRHDRADEVGVGHPRHAAFLANVGGHALEGHHRASSGLLCEAGVLRRDDVHDHATFEHLGKAGLDLERTLHGAVSIARSTAFGHERNSTPGVSLS